MSVCPVCLCVLYVCVSCMSVCPVCLCVLYVFVSCMSLCPVCMLVLYVCLSCMYVCVLCVSVSYMSLCPVCMCVLYVCVSCMYVCPKRMSLCPVFVTYKQETHTYMCLVCMCVLRTCLCVLYVCVSCTLCVLYSACPAFCVSCHICVSCLCVCVCYMSVCLRHYVVSSCPIIFLLQVSAGLSSFSLSLPTLTSSYLSIYPYVSIPVLLCLVVSWTWRSSELSDFFAAQQASVNLWNSVCALIFTDYIILIWFCWFTFACQTDISVSSESS